MLPSAMLLHSAGGYCFLCESPSNWTGKRLAGLFPKLTPWKVLDIYLHSPGTGQGQLARSARFLVPHRRQAGKASLVCCISRASRFDWPKPHPSPPFPGLIPESCLQRTKKINEHLAFWQSSALASGATFSKVPSALGTPQPFQVHLLSTESWHLAASLIQGYAKPIHAWESLPMQLAPWEPVHQLCKRRPVSSEGVSVSQHMRGYVSLKCPQKTDERYEGSFWK